MPKVSVGIILKQESGNLRTQVESLFVLLCQRQKNARFGLKWEFPGGKSQNGESAKQVLHREINEELGITVLDEIPYFQSLNRYSDNEAFEVTYFIINRYEGEIVNNAFERFEWVPLSRLTEYDILDGNIPVTQKLMRDYGENSAR